MRCVTLPSGAEMPVLGLGTWRMGERRTEAAREADALRHGLDLGYRMIDTAEMYGEGGAEEVIAEAIAGRRHEVFLVSKVYPHNASRQGVVEACERSVRRLGTERIELYLLHWPGSHPLEETFAGFEALRAAGKIGDFGVSNFDRDGMEEVRQCDGGRTATNQIYYNLAKRNAEWDLLPWSRQEEMPIMAYSPLDQARMLGDPALAAVAENRGATPAQVALAWLLIQENMVVIPKSSARERVKENLGALEVGLTPGDLTLLERAFPPPEGPARLEII